MKKAIPLRLVEFKLLIIVSVVARLACLPAGRHANYDAELYRVTLSVTYTALSAVRTERFELSWITPYASETYAYTSSATSANINCFYLIINAKTRILAQCFAKKKSNNKVLYHKIEVLSIISSSIWFL